MQSVISVNIICKGVQPKMLKKPMKCINRHFLSTHHNNQSEAIPCLLHFQGQLCKEQFQEVEGVVALKASENWTFLSEFLSTISSEKMVDWS
jgi:hypothetical protein